MLKRYIMDMKREFSHYNLSKLSKDAMAGLTVTAVALPLALAFGVSSGADAAAGLITAILSGIIIGLLSGASFQISGPTGAMTAVLITIVLRYKLQGVFIASLMAGIILLVCGILKLGKLVNLIPMPVVTGFTSGIAIVIVLGQMDNFFGTTSTGETALQKVFSYGKLGFSPNFQAVIIGAIVIAIMLLWPKKWNSRIPSSLVGIIVAGIVSNIAGFNIAMVGNIPRTLLSENRLLLSGIDIKILSNLISPAITIAALGMIESLLCGASASRMKNEPFDADRELVAQGVGNIIIPFFGGVPSTAAIARTSVAIKSGCETRLTGVFHSVGLLASMFLLGPIMARLPLSALAGVLVVTAWRMNEWHAIKSFFTKKLKGAIAEFLITMIATVVFDLTIAILVGIIFAVVIFVNKSSKFVVEVSEIVPHRVKNNDLCDGDFQNVRIVYLVGPMFFAVMEKFKSALSEVDCKVLILSMRGVPTIDTTAVQAIMDDCKKFEAHGKTVLFSGVQSSVYETFCRAGISEFVSDDKFYWDTEDALSAIYNRKAIAVE